MIYLVHPSGAFAACEDAAHATPYVAQGYERCDYGAFRAAWRARDAAALEEMRAEARAVEEAEAQTETAPITGPGYVPANAVGLPDGMVRYIIKR